MFKFAVALFCFQACLVQNAFGQIGWAGEAYTISPFDYAPALWANYGEPLGPYNGAGCGGNDIYNYAGPLAGPVAAGPIEAYGGAGVGEVAVAGELPADGATAVTGQVPILGAVEFGGAVRASGTITIAGSCGCGCAGPFIY